MADPARRRPQNAEGDLFVDESCIDCDTCRWMAPETYQRVDGKSIVARQPDTPETDRRALQALVACPTASIGTESGDAGVKAAARDFPLPITDQVSHCGFHSADSFGAASYFVQRPEGNLLVDSPRYNPGLADRLEGLGGVAKILLTHRDDVADHDRWAQRFGAERVLHRDDVTDATRDVELQPEGPDEVDLDGVVMVPVPGHTRGHAVYRWQDVLFTGDHLAGSRDRERLVAFRRACWYDWEAQTESMHRLLDHRFEWVLPGHGRRLHLPADAMQERLRACIAWMQEA